MRKDINHIFNAFVYCLRIVYTYHFSYIDEYHQVKTTYSLKGDNISRKLYFPYRTRQTIRDKFSQKKAVYAKTPNVVRATSAFIPLS